MIPGKSNSNHMHFISLYIYTCHSIAQHWTIGNCLLSLFSVNIIRDRRWCKIYNRSLFTYKHAVYSDTVIPIAFKKVRNLLVRQQESPLLELSILRLYHFANSIQLAIIGIQPTHLALPHRVTISRALFYVLMAMATAVKTFMVKTLQLGEIIASVPGPIIDWECSSINKLTKWQDAC